MKSTLLTVVFLFLGLQINAQLQSPEEFLGYEIGEQFSRHADVVNYFEQVAKNSPLVHYHTYGKTNERRSTRFRRRDGTSRLAVALVSLYAPSHRPAAKTFFLRARGHEGRGAIDYGGSREGPWTRETRAVCT